MEEWRDVYFWENGIEYDYRGLYQVSNYGRVKSFHNGKEKILKVGKDIRGYESITLSKNSKQKIFKVHRIVAHMFIKGYFENAQVNHKDENKANNHVENLEWCTRKYNINYGTRNEKANESNKNKPKGSLIARFDLNMNLIDVKYNFEYVQLGFNQTGISHCCRGECKSCQGFIFKYYKENLN